jgi:hypothetical protein
MTRTFHPDLPLCQEPSICYSLHPSGRFSSTSERHSVFEHLWDFFPKHIYGKIAATVRMRSSIRQVSDSKSWRPDGSSHGPYARASDQPSGRPFLLSGRTKPWYGNCVQWKCDCPDDRAPPSRRGSNQERISAKFWKADRTVVRLDALWLSFGRRLGFIKLDAQLNLQPINRGP